jgi:hypothetical protein
MEQGDIDLAVYRGLHQAADSSSLPKVGAQTTLRD